MFLVGFFCVGFKDFVYFVGGYSSVNVAGYVDDDLGDYFCCGADGFWWFYHCSTHFESLGEHSWEVYEHTVVVPGESVIQVVEMDPPFLVCCCNMGGEEFVESIFFTDCASDKVSSCCYDGTVFVSVFV